MKPSIKQALVIYYCSGKTCNMSPGALANAELTIIDTGEFTID
jgi:hypothetical protein